MGTDLPPEDVRKLHNEINQIVNQRFLLSTAAVAVFGVVAAWLIPNTPPTEGGTVGALAWAVSILLIILLFALYLLSQLLRNVLRTYSAYLLISEASRWEKDWKAYRNGGYFTYTKAQTIVFLLLGILATLFPIAIGAMYSLKIEPGIGLWLDVIVGLLYVFFVSGMGFWGWFSREISIEQRWKGILG